MKYLLLLLLVFCSMSCMVRWSPSPIPVIVTEKGYVTPIIVSYGSNGINEFKCQVEEVNASVIWVSCNFHNLWPNIAGNSTANSCIRVRFFDQGYQQLLVQSRQICSGPLRAGEKSVNYAAFFKEDRLILRRCFELFDQGKLGTCAMLVNNIEEFDEK